MNERLAGISSNQVQRLDSSAYESGLPAGVGVYHGENVRQVIDVQSLIADACEELTFSASEIVEKKISERKVSSRKDRISEVQKLIEKYLKQVPDIGKPEKIKEFLEHIRRSKPKDPHQLRESLKEFFEDVTHQFVALEILKESSKDAELKELAESLADSMLEESGAEIRAGLNISETAYRFSLENLGDTQSLRDFYRENILDYQGLSQLHTRLVESFGAEDFERAVAFLIEAVGSELRSHGPSIPASQLKKVMDDLYSLEVLGNFHRGCLQLLGDVKRLFGVKPSVSSQQLAGRVLILKEESWVSPSAVEGIVGWAGIQGEEAKIFFLRELRELVRKVPIKVFDSLQQRERLLDAMQEALDALIEEE